MHDAVGVGQVAGDAVMATLEVGLAGKVPTKEQAGTNLVSVQMA